MVKTLSFFVVFLFINLSLGQARNKQKSIDSLLFLAKTTSIDSIKVELYSQLCKKNYPEDLNKMKRYNNKVYALSKKINFKKGIGMYFLNMTDIDYLTGDLQLAVIHGEKAYNLLSQTGDQELNLDAVSYLAYAYLDNADYLKARKLLQQNIPLAHIFGNAKTLGRFYLFLGETFEDETASISELKCYKKSLYYYDKSTDKLGKASLYQRIASVCKKLSLFEEALKYINLAIELKTDDYNHTIILVEKARIYNKLERFSEAKRIALHCEKKIVKNQQFASDLYLVNKLCLAKSNYGLNKYDEAITNSNEILSINKDDETKMSTLNILSDSYLKLNELTLAKKYIDQSLELIEYVNDEGLENTYKIKSEVEEALGNYKSALFFSKKYTSFNDEKNEKINQNKLQYLQVDFEVSEKENEIKKLEIIDLQKTLNLSRQKNYLILSIIITALALILLFVFLRVANTIKKRNEEIQEANIELSQSQLIIKKALNEKELLLKEIHHRVKNNFQLVLSLLNIQAREGDEQDIKYFLEKGQTRISSMALIHENLYQTEKLDEVNFQKYIENLIESIQSTYQHKNENISTEVQALNINFDIQTSIPIGLIINELYCNSLKHAFPKDQKGNVSIQITSIDDETFQLIIADNGIGIEHDENRKKTLGLELVQLLVQQLRGKIETFNENGTKYIITFTEIN